MELTQEVAKLVLSHNLQGLKEYLDKSTKENINLKDKGMGYSLLTLAVTHVDPEATKLLLKYGADPNSIDKHGRTPLFYAGEEQSHLIYDSPQKHLEMGISLINAGAKIDIVDIYGNQPLFKVVFSTKGREDYLPIVKYYLEQGADPNHKNNAGVSPLDFAEKVGYQPLISLLKNK